MKRIAPTLWLLLLACTSVQAGTPDIPDEINARLARGKTQAATEAAARSRGAVAVDGITAIGRAGSASGLGNGCNIAIGNIFEDKKAGISTSAKRETTVIVTGDVIQVGNNCR